MGSWQGKRDLQEDLGAGLERSKTYENYIVSLCPFHQENHPSFFVYPDHYFCKSCGAKGRTDQLLPKISNNYYVPQPTTSNPWTGWLRHNSLLKVLKLGYRILKKYPWQGKYLTNRGIHEDTIKSLKLGFMDGWFTVPLFYPDKKVYGGIARAGDGITGVRYCSPNGVGNQIYVPSWENIESSDYVYMVFGIFDAIILYQIDLPAMTSTQGTRIDPKLLQDIRKNIVIIPDQGEERQASVLASQLGWRGKTKFLDYPDGSKDINDLFLYHPKKLQELKPCQ